ncbi:MAG TPA: rhomboid family intramembrane serine protease [Thermoflexales bacterium]|nr:rhomboid family intramembrane serine protease [Thermoflexales bacterium]
MRNIGRGVVIVLVMAAVMWVIQIINAVVFGQNLVQFGILPRVGDGLRGILFAPLLHASYQHLIGNTLPFLVLGGLLAARSVKDFVVVTIIVWLFSGVGVWLFGAGNSYHVGASGVIFGYFGFLVARGIFERQLVSILMAVAVAALYGGIIVGLNPFAAHVSWVGHLYGLASGAAAAFFMTRGNSMVGVEKAE